MGVTAIIVVSPIFISREEIFMNSEINTGIVSCIFMLDYIRMTMLSSNPSKTLKEMNQYLRFSRTVPEAKTRNPVFAGKLAIRKYFSLGEVEKAWVTYRKISPVQGYNMALEMHDVPHYEMQQIEWLLTKCSSVQSFNFARIEPCWDFFPESQLTALELQNFFACHFHLKHAREAKIEGSDPRNTYYIGNEQSGIFMKIYIRPKDFLIDHEPERVRVELTAKRIKLTATDIHTPSSIDLKRVRSLVSQISWLEIDMHKIRRSLCNTLSGGKFLDSVKYHLSHNGIAETIIYFRDRKSCPNACNSRMNPKVCPKSDRNKCHVTPDEINDCPASRVMTDFETNYLRNYKQAEVYLSLMEQAFINWRDERHNRNCAGMKPLFKPNYSVPKLLDCAERVRKRKTKVRDFELPKLWK
jgi:hypothetical protein